MFQVTTMDLNNVPKTDQGDVDFSEDFFGKDVYKRQAFDTSPKTEYQYTKNMDLFNSYARGGIEYLYEKLVVRPVDLDDEEFMDARMSNIMALFRDCLLYTSRCV